ncbi:MAG: metallo-beta-lactamase family protein, partial [Akkermansiaceae bacterium]|nr:metallo-beta-lactamase family protein [Akkermansiaceae bacterium]
MRFVVLGSGSGGNATVVEAAGTRVLIDAGLSAKQLIVRMAACGIDPATLDAVILTHEHGDHVSGLRVLATKLAAPVYATPSTSRVVRDSGVEGAVWRIFESGA